MSTSSSTTINNNTVVSESNVVPTVNQSIETDVADTSTSTTDSSTVTKNGKKKKVLSEKTKLYIKNFMAERYKRNPVYHKKKRGTDNYKKLYNVPKEVCETFAEDLQHIIRIHNLITELNDGSFEKYLMIKNNFNVTKKEA
jgi:hypothetical protein